MELLIAILSLALVVVLTAVVSIKLTRRSLHAKNKIERHFEDIRRSVEELKSAVDQKETELLREFSARYDDITRTIDDKETTLYRHIRDRDRVYFRPPLFHHDRADLLKANESLVRSLKQPKRDPELSDK